MENKKKTKWFVETPWIIVEIMHKYLALQENETLADFTAWKWKLFLNHNPDNCFWFELDIENFNHIKETYKNIILWDFYDNIENHHIIDNLILNPPYIKQSNEIIFKSLEKLKDWWRFCIISKDTTLKNLKNEYENLNIHIDIAMKFDTNLFKPFANVKTILIFWIKWKQQWEFEILEFSNNEIIVNTRAKIIEPKILNPKETIKWNSNFWEKLNELPEYNTRPTLQDFENTVINYMAWDTWLPADMIRNPKKLFEWLNKLLNYK